MNAKLSLGLAACAVTSIASAFYAIHLENNSLRNQTEALRQELRYLPRPVEARPLLRASMHPAESRAIPVPGEAQPLALDLAVGETLFGRYRAILETSDGDVVWVGDHIKPRGRIVQVEIPPGVVEPRKYVLRLAGASTNSVEPVADFAFRLLSRR
jgi:hypothetical protein